MRIRVTRQHIRDGCKMSCVNCPVALAIKEALGVESGVLADLEAIYINEVRFETPAQVERFMDRFDCCTNRGWLRGFEFELSIEEAVP